MDKSGARELKTELMNDLTDDEIRWIEPTNELRWGYPVKPGQPKVLQQRWKIQKRGMVSEIYGGGVAMGWIDAKEWRDVPYVLEEIVELTEDIKENAEDATINDEPEMLDDVVESIADMCGIYGEERIEFVIGLKKRINNAVCNGLARTAFDRMMEKIKDE